MRRAINHLGVRIKQRSTTQNICIGIGVIFIFLGMVGLLYPEFAGGHFSLMMNVLHIASGSISFYVGTHNNHALARTFSIIGLAFTGILGLSGLLFGVRGFASVGYEGLDRFHLVLIPKVIELGMVDHILNLVLALIFLVALKSYNPRE